MAESGRADYDRLIRFSQLEPGEPYFFIRGRDRVGGAAVRAWAALATEAGAPAAIVESALQQADRLDQWPTKQLPDADHLTTAEQLELTYQLSRRAWHWRTDHLPDEQILLAEMRGAVGAMARIRHADVLVTALLDELGPLLKSPAISELQRDRVRRAFDRVAHDVARRSPGPRSTETDNG